MLIMYHVVNVIVQLFLALNEHPFLCKDIIYKWRHTGHDLVTLVTWTYCLHYHEAKLEEGITTLTGQ